MSEQALARVPNEMDIAVIGAGSIGRRHIKGLRQLSEELGVGQIRVFDPNTERCEDAAQLASDVVACSTLPDAVASVETVFVCAPTSLHTQVVEELRSLGSYHIFMEKPLASVAHGWAEFLEQHQRGEKVFAVGYMLPKHPVLRRLKELLAEDVVGRVLHARAESGFYLPYWHPQEDYRDFYMSSRTAGGGALLDTSHEIHYLTWLFGPITEVSGSVETTSDLEITSDDLVLATFRFDSGLRGQVHLDLLQFDESRYCKVIGTEGVVKADLMANEVSCWKKDEKVWHVERIEAAYDDIYSSEYRDFIAACRGEPNEIVNGASALHVLEVVEAVRRSHSLGVVVKLTVWDI